MPQINVIYGSLKVYPARKFTPRISETWHTISISKPLDSFSDSCACSKTQLGDNLPKDRMFADFFKNMNSKHSKILT